MDPRERGEDSFRRLIWKICASAPLAGVFIADYGFDAFAKPVPREAYAILLTVAAGVRFDDFRNALLRIMEKRFSSKGD